MIESVLMILCSPVLLATAILCIILGSASFASAIHLSSLKGIGVASVKYILAFISVESISNLFMIILAPDEFLKYHSTFNTFQIGMVILLGWVLLYESLCIVKTPASARLKEYLKKLFHKK